MVFGGTLLASRVATDEFKYSSHLILKLVDALAVTISCSFSRLSSGVVELSEKCLSIYKGSKIQIRK
jgi:hypothetical protein